MVLFLCLEYLRRHPRECDLTMDEIAELAAYHQMQAAAIEEMRER